MQPARKSKTLSALEDAAHMSEAGVVTLRSGSDNGRVFFVGGKIAWATASTIKKNFSLRVVEATGLSVEAVQTIFDDCKRSGKNFGETVIERGLLDEKGLRRLLLDHVAGCLKEMLTWEAAEPTFSPERRAYKVNLTFDLAEALKRADELDDKAIVSTPEVRQSAPAGERLCPRCGKRFPESVSYCDADGTRLTGIDGAPAAGGHGAALVGSVIGSYRILELLGEGGMGHVYLAEHTRLARKVALKMLRPEYADSAGAIKRFFMEARAVNQIKHENIVEITDFIEGESGRNYYIMELLEGRSLDEELAEKGPLSVRRAVGVAVQVAGALAAVHQAGIIHRDLKPDNIFLCRRGERQDLVKLLDFGVAKLIGPLPDVQAHKTAAGAILGTPEYMSPEQVSGKEVDFRSDIYSLGIIMFEMVTGKKPFTARTFGELVIKHLTVKPVRPSQMKDAPVRLPRAFEELVMQCLEKEPARRPASMKEIEERLRKLAGMNSAQLSALGMDLHPVGGWWRRWWAWALAMALLLGVAGGLTLWLLWPPEKPVPQPSPPEPPGEPERVAPAPQAERVEIGFESSPTGAEVFQAGKLEPLGKTPCKLVFSRSPESARFEIRLAGFKPVNREVALDRNGAVSVALTREKKPLPPPPEKKKPPPKTNVLPDSEDTIDPFSE